MERHVPTNRELPRRSFFGALVAAGSACVAAAFAIPTMRVVLFPLRGPMGKSPDPVWSDLGPLETFAQAKAPVSCTLNIERQDGWQLAKLQQSVYVLPGSEPGSENSQPRVVSSICPHLGCTVQWRSDSNNFVCPCHNGTYRSDGGYVAGPPKRAMDELPTRVKDGHLQVQFQYYRQLDSSKEVAG